MNEEEHKVRLRAELLAHQIISFLQDVDMHGLASKPVIKEIFEREFKEALIEEMNPMQIAGFVNMLYALQGLWVSNGT